MSDVNDPAVSVPSLAGSLLAACILNWCFFGVLLVQTYLYYAAFPNDRRLVQVLVYGVFICELAQTIIITRDIFAAFVNAFGNVGALDGIHNYWFTIPVSGGVAGFIGQIFFAYRINRFSNGARTIPIFILTLAATSGCASLVAAAQFHQAGSFSALSNNSLTAVGVWNGVGALCDVAIAVFMPYFLLRAGTGLSHTHNIITTFLRLIIEAGAITAILALAHLIFYFTRSPSSQLFIIFGAIISKVYSNTVMMLLNHRMNIPGGRTEASSGDSAIEFSYPSRLIVDNERVTVRLDELPVAARVASNASQTPKP